MKKYLVAALMIAIAVTALFTLPSFINEEEIDLHTIISKANLERKTILESEVENDIEQYAYNVTGDKEGFTDDEIEMILQKREVTQSEISREDALEDADYLFRLLKYVYGGYGYYGGDEVFDQVKSKVIDSIGIEDEISITDLNEILLEHLSFIADGHMVIGGTSVNKEHLLHYYCNQQIEVGTNNRGFYYSVDNEKRYIQSINNDSEVEKYLKLSINEEGELVYYIGILQNDGDAVGALQLEYDLNSQIKSDEIKVSRASRKWHQEPTAFEQKTIEGIPVLICRKMDDQPEENSLKYLVESGLQLKNEDVFIIDLRGNSGGGGLWSVLWYENYTGVTPHTGISNFKRFSKLYLHREKMNQDIIIEPFLEKYDMPRLNEAIERYFESRSQSLNSKDYDAIEMILLKANG